MLLLPTIIYFLRGFEGAAGVGDSLNSIFRIFPSYVLSKAILFCGTADTLQKAREEFKVPEAVPRIDLEVWSTENFLGDCIFIGVVFFVATLMVAVFEGLICKPYWSRLV